MKRVAMNMSPVDLANVGTLVKLPAIRNNTHAVTTSLAITAFLAGKLRDADAELLIRRADGEVERILVPELAGHATPNGAVTGRPRPA